MCEGDIDHTMYIGNGSGRNGLLDDLVGDCGGEHEFVEASAQMSNNTSKHLQENRKRPAGN